MSLPSHIQLPEQAARPHSRQSPQTAHFAFIGKANSGKTTLFNRLTGLRQKIANYDGVTVAAKTSHCFSRYGHKQLLSDLPGTRSFYNPQTTDEKVVHEILLGSSPNASTPNHIICVADAMELESGITMALELAEFGLPMIFVVNMVDIANKQGLRINRAKLEGLLGMPVVAAQGHKTTGALALKVVMSRPNLPTPAAHIEYPSLLSQAILAVQNALIHQGQKDLQAVRGRSLLALSQGPNPALHDPETYNTIANWRERLSRESPYWQESLTKARQNKAAKIAKSVIKQKGSLRTNTSAAIDKVLMHPIGRWLGLATVMSALFWSIFSLAEYPIEAIELLFTNLGVRLESVLPAGPLSSLAVDGVLAGIRSIVAFLPPIALLFIFTGILESTGYLPRAAAILDKPLKKIGLQGRAFIPLLSSYACAIPGILATRTIHCPKKRLATILIAPWMSCAARLPLYLLLVSILFPAPSYGALTRSASLIGLYALGTAMACLTAWAFRKTLLKDKLGSTDGPAELLPSYKWPNWSYILSYTGERIWTFLREAGTVILALSIVLWFLMSFPNSGAEASTQEQITNSFAGWIGHAIEPIFAPLGFDWKIGIAIVASFAAREIFVSTLAILYSLETVASSSASLGQLLLAQTWPDGSPVYTPLTCISLLVFFAFAMQCMSTLAVTRSETKSLKWPVFQLIYMTSIAYISSLIIYQGGRYLVFV